MVGPIKLLTFNCWGFNTQITLKQISNMLTKERPLILFLQETHQKLYLPRIIKSNWFLHQFQVPGSLKDRGVAIAILKNLPLHHPECIIDPNDRFIFVKRVIDDALFMLASIYASNSNQISFLKDTLTLENFKTGVVLIGGDLNLVEDPFLDRTLKNDRKTRDKQKLSPTLYSVLQSHNLVDICRLLYPTSKQYTFYSLTHLTHSCIDSFDIFSYWLFVMFQILFSITVHRQTSVWKQYQIMHGCLTENSWWQRFFFFFLYINFIKNFPLTTMKENKIHEYIKIRLQNICYKGLRYIAIAFNLLTW